jgi:hypothetical protein
MGDAPVIAGDRDALRTLLEPGQLGRWRLLLRGGTRACGEEDESNRSKNACVSHAMWHPVGSREERRLIRCRDRRSVPITEQPIGLAPPTKV